MNQGKKRTFTRLRIAAGIQAELLCAGRFVYGRAKKNILAEDLGFLPLFKLFRKSADPRAQNTLASLLIPGLFKKKAVFVDGFGAVLLNGIPEARVRGWNPRIPSPRPVRPDRVPWPTGDLLPHTPPSGPVDQAKLDAAVEDAFSDESEMLFDRGDMAAFAAAKPLRQALFNRIGMRGAVFQPDAIGPSSAETADTHTLIKDNPGR